MITLITEVPRGQKVKVLPYVYSTHELNLLISLIIYLLAEKLC